MFQWLKATKANSQRTGLSMAISQEGLSATFVARDSILLMTSCWGLVAGKGIILSAAAVGPWLATVGNTILD